MALLSAHYPYMLTSLHVKNIPSIIPARNIIL